MDVQAERELVRIIAFGDPVEASKSDLGGKGASLVSMVQAGLPVPPGFILPTAIGRAWLQDGGLSPEVMDDLHTHLDALERTLDQRLGDTGSPLLVAVRSGAPVSMPGMMDTVLNVGLNEDVVEALAALTGDDAFAWSSYERLLETYASVVREIPSDEIDDALLELPHPDGDRAAASKAACQALLRVIETRGAPFPRDPRDQITECLEAVFRSWNGRRAKAYREHRGIDHGLATAAVIQSMVFGNRGQSSGSGVAFSRDPSTGEPGPYGDFLVDAQGEDVVAGTADPAPLALLAEKMPAAHEDLCDILVKLERYSSDLIECEFTIEQGRLWILQFRPAQRSGRAAVRCAVDFVDEGLIDKATAIAQVDDEQLEAATAPRFSAPPAEADVLARGCPASPGAGVGRAVFDASRAQTQSTAGDHVILVRPTTSPSDIHGFIASVGIVTGRGGRTSHAAVVARGMGRPAVCGVGEVKIDRDKQGGTIAGVRVAEGDLLAVDGDRGIVALVAPTFAGEHDDERLTRFLSWRRAA